MINKGLGIIKIKSRLNQDQIQMVVINKIQFRKLILQLTTITKPEFTFASTNSRYRRHRASTPSVSTVAQAKCSMYHTVLRASPGQLLFGRDMVLPIQFEADWARIKLQKQETIDKSNTQENAMLHVSRTTTKSETKCLWKNPVKSGRCPNLALDRLKSLKCALMVPSASIRCGNITEQVNIRRLTPYFERPNQGSKCHRPA